MKFSDIFWITTLVRFENQQSNDDNYGCGCLVMIVLGLLFIFSLIF